jgi:hypothetical protein
MGKNTYSDKLKDPRWQKKRLEIFERDDWTCQRCGDKDQALVVHHRNYKPDYDPWDYSDDCLVTLCQPCHDSEGETWPDTLQTMTSALRQQLWAEQAHRVACAIGLMKISEFSGTEDVIMCLEILLPNSSLRRDFLKWVGCP